MKLAIFWFTFRNDARCVLQSVRSVRHFAPAASLHVVEDAAAPLPDHFKAVLRENGAELHEDRAPRNGNLNGMDNLLAQWRRFAGHEAGADWVVKIDSDTVLNAPPEEWLSKAGECHQTVCAGQPLWWYQGACYALRRGVADAMLREAPRARQILGRLAPKFPEDVCTATMIAHIFGPESILTLPGHSKHKGLTGDQIAHYDYRRGPSFEPYGKFKVITFGDRDRLPEQMPDSVKRYTASKYMGAFLDFRLVPPLAVI